MRKFIYLSLLFFIVACSTHKSRREILDSWLGKSEDELVSSWSIPDGTYEKDIKYYDDLDNYKESRKTKYLIYNKSYNQYMPDAYRMNQPLSGSFVAKNCKTIFAIDVKNNEIMDWKYEGNGC